MPAHSPLACSHSSMTNKGQTGIVMLLNTGNYPGEANYLNMTYTWSGTDWTQVSTSQIDPNGPLPLRLDFGMSFDGTNIVLFGGRGQSETAGVLSDTWTWNGSVWSRVGGAFSGSPFGRFKHELAYSPATGTIMFGGSNILNFLNDTWNWNGSVWTQLSPTTSPSVRINHMIAGGISGGGQLNYVLMFGGSNSNSFLNDTWKIDATNQWTQLSPTTSPSVRAECAMTYDTVNKSFVLFGGRDNFGLRPPETWIFDGTNWTKKSPTNSPSGRVGAQLSMDPNGSGKVILMGGNDLTNPLSDTWQWDGNNWTQL